MKLILNIYDHDGIMNMEFYWDVNRYKGVIGIS